MPPTMLASSPARRREHLRSQASEQTARLGSSIRSLSEQLDGALKGKAPEGAAADLLRQATERTQHMAQSLERNPDELLEDLRRFARRRPGVFLAGAMGLGFVTGRFLRAINTRSLVDAAKSGATPEEGSEGSGGDGSSEPRDGEQRAEATGPADSSAALAR